MFSEAASLLPIVCGVCGSPFAPMPGEHCPNCLLRVSVENLVPDLLSEDGKLAQLGDYELLDEIARGGVGVVYRARQHGLGRIVAVKVLVAGEFASTETRRRFRVEAEAAARLQHPGIVSIHEVGETDGLAWFSMEYVSGGTLADLVQEHPLDSRAAAQHVHAIAEAVQHAHEQGVLHRDLKPSNILLDRASRPRITDFGLARRCDTTQTLTRTGVILGSPGYMAPEQAFGEDALIGPATDVYGLGALLYHLLTGRPPFQAPTCDAVLLQLREREPLPPRRLNPEVPRDLETICLRCLHKVPAKRYPTALEVADDLARALEGKPIRARPISPLEKTYRWCRRRPATAALLTAFAVLAITAGVLRNAAIVTEGRRAEIAERFAREQRRTALVAQAQLRLRSHEAGRRIESLRLLREAWALGPSVEIRSATLTALALPDAVELPTPTDVDLVEPASSPDLQLHVATRILHNTFDPGTRRIAAAGYDNLIYVLDAERRTVTRRLRGHEGACTSLAFSPDGNWLATTANDHTLRLWDVRSGEELLVIDQTLHEDQPDLRWSADGDWLSIAPGRALRITRPVVAHTFAAEIDETRSEGTCTIDLSADGRWLVTVTESGTHLWDTRTLRETAFFAKAGAEWSAARFSPDSRRLWIGGWNSGIQVVDLPELHDGPIPRPTYIAESAGSLYGQSPDGAWLIALSNYGGGFQFVSSTKPSETRWLKQRHPLSLAVSSNGTLAATSSYDAAGVCLWDFRTLRALRTFPAPAPAQLAFTSDGNQLISGTGRSLTYWNPVTGERLREIDLGAPLRSLACSADGRLVAVELRTGVALLSAGLAGVELARLDHVSARGTASFCFSEDGSQLAIQTDLGGATVWELDSLRQELAAVGMAWPEP